MLHILTIMGGCKTMMLLYVWLNQTVNHLYPKILSSLSSVKFLVLVWVETVALLRCILFSMFNLILLSFLIFKKLFCLNNRQHHRTNRCPTHKHKRYCMIPNNLTHHLVSTTQIQLDIICSSNVLNFVMMPVFTCQFYNKRLVFSWQGQLLQSANCVSLKMFGSEGL